jgi:hypothetical protein
MLAMQSNMVMWKLNAQIERLLQSLMRTIHRRIMLLDRVTVPRDLFPHEFLISLPRPGRPCITNLWPCSILI